MAYIGMRKPQFATIASRTDGSAITYGTPLVIGPAVSASISFENNDNPDYGDDVVINNDKGVNGYSITLETTEISAEGRAKCLGWKPVTNGSPAAVTHYEITDAAPPEGGLAFIRVALPKHSSTRKYEAFFFHCLQFSDGAENANTKEKAITWNHPSMDGTGIGVYIDSSGEAKYFDWMEFDSESAAQTWINGKFNYSPPAETLGAG